MRDDIKPETTTDELRQARLREISKRLSAPFEKQELDPESESYKQQASFGIKPEMMLSPAQEEMGLLAAGMAGAIKQGPSNVVDLAAARESKVGDALKNRAKSLWGEAEPSGEVAQFDPGKRGYLSDKAEAAHNAYEESWKKRPAVPGVDKGAKLPPVETISDDVFDIKTTPEQLAEARAKFKEINTPPPDNIIKMGKTDQLTNMAERYAGLNKANADMGAAIGRQNQGVKPGEVIGRIGKDQGPKKIDLKSLHPEVAKLDKMAIYSAEDLENLNSLVDRFGKDQSNMTKRIIKAQGGPEPYLSHIGKSGKSEAPFAFPNYNAPITGKIGSEKPMLQFGSDPFQWADSKFGATKKLLQKYRDAGQAPEITTGSDLIARDDYMELIPKNSKINLQLPTGGDDPLLRILAPGNTSSKRVVAAYEKLKKAGHDVSLVLPSDRELEEMLLRDDRGKSVGGLTGINLRDPNVVKETIAGIKKNAEAMTKSGLLVEQRIDSIKSKSKPGKLDQLSAQAKRDLEAWDGPQETKKPTKPKKK